MIKKEFYKTRADGIELEKTYSDSGMMIKKVQTNELYCEAIDILGSNFSYEETGITIDDFAKM